MFKFSQQKLGFTQHQHRGAGFTLIELLVVIAIIGTLSAVGVVSFNSAREKAKNAAMLQTMRNIMPLIQTCYSTDDAFAQDCEYLMGEDEPNFRIPSPSCEICNGVNWPELPENWEYSFFFYDWVGQHANWGYQIYNDTTTIFCQEEYGEVEGSTNGVASCKFL